jgi:hypothetical protein
MTFGVTEGSKRADSRSTDGARVRTGGADISDAEMAAVLGKCRAANAGQPPQGMHCQAPSRGNSHNPGKRRRGEQQWLEDAGPGSAVASGATPAADATELILTFVEGTSGLAACHEGRGGPSRHNEPGAIARDTQSEVRASRAAIDSSGRSSGASNDVWRARRQKGQSTNTAGSEEGSRWP